MSPLKKMIGMAIAASRDMAVGLIIAHLLAPTGLSRLGSVAWHVMGMSLSVLPDFDIFLQKLFGGVINSQHRKLMHAPAFMIGVVAALFYPVLPRLSVMAMLCLFFHFVDDTVGDENEGTGIAWLWPLSGKSLSFFFKENGRRKIVAFRDLGLVTPWPLEKWLQRYWLVPTKEMFISLFAAALAIAVLFWF